MSSRVARTRWRAAHCLDLFNHGGGGNGFLTDLWWLPQLQLGIAVLTNSSRHDLQGSLAIQILTDLVTRPDSPYRERLLGSPTQPDVIEPDSHFAPRPTWADGSRRWRCRRHPRRSPDGTTSRCCSAPAGSGRCFRRRPRHVSTSMAGSPTSMQRRRAPLQHRLVEFQPGLFLADNGQTLDLRGPTPHWHGLRLNPVDNGPLAAQWVLLALVVVIAAGWLLATPSTRLRHRPSRRADTSAAPAERPAGRAGRRATTTVAVLGALSAISTAVGVRVVPGLVDVGYLGWLPFPPPVLVLLHRPLAAAVLAAALVALLAAGALRQWWSRPIRLPDAALALALTALATQLALLAPRGPAGLRARSLVDGPSILEPVTDSRAPSPMRPGLPEG